MPVYYITVQMSYSLRTAAVQPGSVSPGSRTARVSSIASFLRFVSAMNLVKGLSGDDLRGSYEMDKCFHRRSVFPVSLMNWCTWSRQLLQLQAAAVCLQNCFFYNSVFQLSYVEAFSNKTN